MGVEEALKISEFYFFYFCTALLWQFWLVSAKALRLDGV